MAVTSPLLKTVAIGVIGMLGPVLAPVLATACRPGPVRLSLINPNYG